MSYDSQTATALGLLKRRGTPLTLTRIGVPAIRDVVSQTSVPVSPVAQPIVAVIFPASVSRDMTDDQRAQVRKNRRLLYIAGRAPDGSVLAIEPEDGDTIPFEGSTWTVATQSRLAPDGGLPVLFTVEAAR